CAAGTLAKRVPAGLDSLLVRDARESSEVGGWRLVRLLGHGGMGAVYEAVDATGARVALKLLIEDASRAATAKEISRFEREGAIAAAVDDRHVARVLAARRDPKTNMPFLACELLEGGSLEAKVKKGALPPREAAALGAQVARGLAAIHAVGIVHRDLKPANVLFDENGVAKIADFGLARSLEAAQERLTKTGELLGTAAYLAPEQIEASKTAGPPADLYALGAVLHALASGEPPFRGSNVQLLKAHLADKPPPLRSLVPATPPALEALVLRLLSKEPLDRPSASEVVRELDAIAAGKTGVGGPRVAPLAVGGVLVVLVAAAGVA